MTAGLLCLCAPHHILFHRVYFPKSVRNRCVIEVVGGVFMFSRCFLDFSVGVGAFVIGLSQISSFFSTFTKLAPTVHLDTINRATWWFLFLIYISRLSDHGKEEMVQSILQYLWVLHLPNSHKPFTINHVT